MVKWSSTFFACKRYKTQLPPPPVKKNHTVNDVKDPGESLLVEVDKTDFDRLIVWFSRTQL